MNDIYAAPTADLAQARESERFGGNIDDAVSGNFNVQMLQTLGEAWRDLKGFKLKCMVAGLLYMLAFIVIGMGFAVLAGILGATGADQSVLQVLSFLAQIVITAVALPMAFALLIMAMRHAHGRSVTVSEIFRHFGSIFSLMVCYILQTIMIFIGFLLLILPGIYLMFAYMYAMPLIVEKKMGPWQAMETSRKAISKVWFRFFGLFWLIWLINMLAMLTLGIAWIWTIPWSVLAVAMVYQKIFGVEAHTLAE